MKSRRAFYKKHVAKSIRVMMALFIVSYIVMFGVVLDDSFIHHLPFHYILFFLACIIHKSLISAAYAEVNGYPQIFHVRE